VPVIDTMEKLKTLLWFLKRPAFYMAALHIFFRRAVLRNDRRQHHEALTWCNSNKSKIEEIIAFFTPTIESPFSTRHKELIDRGKKIIGDLPVTMGGAGGIDIIFAFARILRPKKSIETGVAAGWSSLAILKAIEDIKDAVLISVDMPYPKMNNENYVGCVVPESLRQKWTLIREPDRNGLVKALKMAGKLDFCHYDSDKSYSGRRWAYRLIWKHLNHGGILISDDIQDNIAFKKFCDEVKKEPFILEDNNRYIGIIINK
jgi:predicted O-methyltransferase YrrM